MDLYLIPQVQGSFRDIEAFFEASRQRPTPKSLHGCASCSPISRCSRLTALSGRTITLKLVMRPSSPTVMMSTPLILMPSISPSNSTTAPVSLRHSPTKAKLGVPRTVTALERYFERDVAPALSGVHDGT